MNSRNSLQIIFIIAMIIFAVLDKDILCAACIVSNSILFKWGTMNYVPTRINEPVIMKTGKAGVITKMNVSKLSNKVYSYLVKLEDGSEIIAVPSDFRGEG